MEKEQNNDDYSSEDEEIIVYVNFEEAVDECSEENLINMKVLGLDTKEPVLQIGNQIYGGSWNETVGTALFFEETEPIKKKCFFSERVSKPFKYLSKTSKSLDLKRIFISEKMNPSETEEPNATDSSVIDDPQTSDPEN